MRYEERFRRYLNGELDRQEAESIREDMEKLQVLLDYLDESMDRELYESDGEEEKEAGEKETGEKEAGEKEAEGKKEGEKETGGKKAEGKNEEKRRNGHRKYARGGGSDRQELGKEVSRAVSRKLRRYAMITGAVVIVVVLLLLYGLSPLLDRVCYNPYENIEIIDEETQSGVIYSPFQLIMSVYMELFCGDKGFTDVGIRPEGYGRYTIDVQTQINGEITHHPLELVRNHLYLQDLNWNRADFPDNAFTYRQPEISCAMQAEEARKKLEDVPEAVKIRAAISFDNEKNLEELKEFMGRHATQYLYCPIVKDDYGYGGNYWGFAPEHTGYILTDGYDQEKYPYLDLFQYEESDDIPAEVYEKHITSMLNYMLDHEEFLGIFDSDVPGENVVNTLKYQSVLHYIEENGVSSYGTVVYATKKELLDILEDSSVDGVYMLDSSLDLKF